MIDLDEHNKRRDAIIAKGKQNHGVGDVELTQMTRDKYHDVFLDVAGFAAWSEGKREIDAVEIAKLKDAVEQKDAVIAELMERLGE